jgi:translation initiation factor 5A
MSRITKISELKVGHLIVIDGEPCRIVALEKSKPGKHGAAKARIVAIGIFDNEKRSLIRPVDARIEVPILEKRTGQVLSILPTSIQIMDLETYEDFWIGLPKEELRRRLAPGVEVEYWRAVGKAKIIRVR